MTLEVIESKFGKNPIIAKDGFMFHFKSDGCSKKIWLCAERITKRCPVRIHTTDCRWNPQLILEVGSHSHEPNPAKIDVKRMMAKVKKNAANSQETPQHIIAKTVEDMPLASKANMPLAHNLSRMIKKVRAEENCSSVNSNSHEDIDLPTLYTDTSETGDFILSDAGPYVDVIVKIEEDAEEYVPIQS